MQLEVMVFNIEHGGTPVSFKKVVDGVKKADLDVLGIEEAQTNTPRLARQAGHPYFNSSTVTSTSPRIWTTRPPPPSWPATRAAS